MSAVGPQGGGEGAMLRTHRAPPAARAGGPTGGMPRPPRVRSAYVDQKLTPAAWRDLLRRSVGILLSEGAIIEKRSRFELTPAGRSAIVAQLGGKPLPAKWSEIRDVRLIAHALGLQSQPASQLKSLARPDGLRTAILQRAFGFNIKGTPSASKLRSALAIVALEGAFGNKIKGSVGRTGFSGKLGRLLAAHLAVRPRDFGTDSRLVAALAAEKVGAFQTDAESLRVAILRAFVGPSLALAQTVRAATPAIVAVKPVAPDTPMARPRPAAAMRPDLVGFARVVRSAAAANAEGWSGNRKAFVSHVWLTVQGEHPEWGLTDIEFKAMLAEAHRTGHLTLADADLQA